MADLGDFENTEVLIIPPGHENAMMGYDSESTLIAIKTWYGGKQYGRVYQITAAVASPDDPVAIRTRDEFLTEMAGALCV